MTSETTAAWLAFAGRAFLQPDAGTLRESLRELGEVDHEWAPLAALERSLVDAGAAGLAVEHVRLFLDPGGAPCAPWQSAWGSDGRLMGNPHLGALAWYRRFGFTPSLENEPADHAGLLLLFASYLLSAKEGDALPSFAAGHLDWIPRFCQLVSASTRLDFYRLLADLTGRLCHEFLDARATTSSSASSTAACARTGAAPTSSSAS
jgi:TorA maturation chaperone TorD